MGGDVHLFVKMCPHCSACKSTGPKKRAKLQGYQVGAPLDRLHLDILGPFPVSSSGNKYILVIIDQFTRWVEAFPIPDQGAETTAKKLVYDFIARFGAPLELHTDQGRNFESSLFRNVCRLLQITKTRTTPYHPSSNGQVERFNRTLLQMLRCYVDRNQKNWDEQLPLLTAAYRSSQHMVTGFTPNRLMLGREVHQPHDIQCGAARLKSNAMEVVDYIYKLEESLKEAQSLARSHLRTAQERQKKVYDLRANEHSYDIGDLVFVKDDTKKKGLSPKLQALWRGPLIVAAHRGPVLYEIQGPKHRTIMHHDRLKPYNSDVIPVWISRQRCKILQQCQDPDLHLNTEDAPLAPVLPLPDDPDKASQSEGPSESCQSDGSGQAVQPRGPVYQPGSRQGDEESSEKTFKTSSGRIVNRPERFRH
uniref:Pol polyprotein n=1 Tax=Fundulus heteroclitus TaxID=8078 RepID=A0A146QJK2_FUNHE